MSVPALVIMLRVVSVLAFVGPMLRSRRASLTHPRQSTGAQFPVIANFAAAGLFFLALFVFSGALAGPGALLLAISGATLAIAAGALVLRSRRELGAAWSLAPEADQSTGLVTTGPYRLIRHPIYVGFALLAIGQALTFDSMPALGIALFGIVPTFVWRAYVEEALLSRTFDAQYNSYRMQTKMFIPFVL